MGVLMLAKRVDEIVRAQDRRDWLAQPPCNDDLAGAQALIIGYGAIGSRLGDRLETCGMIVTGVRRNADPAAGVIGADAWRPRLGDYDYVILAAPETPETAHMIASAEFDAMKTGARFVNIARGSMVDQDALIAALKGGRLRSAFIDVTDPSRCLRIIHSGARPTSSSPCICRGAAISPCMRRRRSASPTMSGAGWPASRSRPSPTSSRAAE